MRATLNRYLNQFIFIIITTFTLLFIISRGDSFAAVGGLPGTANLDFNPASDSEGNHCVNRFGKDFNQVFGVSEQFLTPLCNKINSGEFYIPETAWRTNTENGLPGFPVLYPQGYTPTDPDPMMDFLSKIVAMKYWVDGRKEYIFPIDDNVSVVTDGEIFPGATSFPNETPIALFLHKLPPENVGDHSVQVRWILSAEHCSGLGTNRTTSCRQAGESLQDTRTFEVVAGAAQSR